MTSLNLDAGGAELPYERLLEEAASLDSIAVLEFITAVEQEFGISMEPDSWSLSSSGTWQGWPLRGQADGRTG